jgi:anaphase-promoting complex subunit 3
MGGGAAGEDDYPYKLPRADPLVASPTSGAHRSSETSNRALPHKLILSPFPVESSPIAQSQQDGGTPGDELAGGPFLQTTTVRKKYGARGQAASGPAGAALGDNKENGASASNRREEHTAGIAAMDETFSGADCQERSGRLVSVDTRAVDHLVVTFARAYQMLSTYCCRACINELQSQLPEKHFRSALVSQWVGKAYYEMNEYKSAMLAFREMLRVEPFRLCGLETLSTALWHLKRDKELCALAQQVVEVDKLAPESWCVVGNCFSLQKEPDTAIRFFQRALQLDPAFTYAHTLCGHEQVNNEDLEKAVESFRAAILHSDRHYNAWYGLGSIYFRQEKYELAEYHFRRALGINPASSVLHCYLGACGALFPHFYPQIMSLLRVTLLSVS